MSEKKRLNHFLNDMLKLSCVKGFKHFATHMRGREEMVCSIVNEPLMPIVQSATNSPAASFGHHKREAFPMSQKQQRRLSGYGFLNVGLPPASPSENEEVDENQTMFLIAGYSRYNRPYVWVRTNHERLVKLTSEEEKDYPLLLQTTSQWQEKDVKVWDVLTELVEICTAPCPPNPFAVDLDYFKSLQLPERALASAAMIAFLQKLIASGPHHYDRRIQSDVGKISRIHFQAMLRMLQEGTIQTPSSSSFPTKQSTTQRTHTQGRPLSATTPAEHSSMKPTQATAVQPSNSPAILPPISSTLPSQPEHSAPIQTSIAPRPIFTPMQPTHSSGLSAAPTYPSQAQPYHTATQVQAPSAANYYPHQPVPTPVSGGSGPSIPASSSMEPQAPSGGLFYSRRMGGSYNY